MKRKIKKTAAIILTVVSVFTLAGCGDSQKVETQSEVVTVPGEIIDAGDISAICPDGWGNIGSSETSASTSSASSASTNELKFVKGGSDEEEMLTNAYIDITCYSGNNVMQIEPTEWYDNVVSLESFTTGDYTWTGYSASTMGVPFVYVTTEADGKTVEAYLYTREGSENSALITDADVLAILQSISFE